MIYKQKDIEASISTRGVNIDDIDLVFYTEDNGTASLRISIKKQTKIDGKIIKDPLNLTKTKMKPELTLIAEDGSIFANEPLEILIPEKGVISYKLSNYVIKHVGKVNAKLFLRHKEESMHVADFHFMINDSGFTGAIGKEIKVPLLNDIVKKVMYENIEHFKGEKGETFKFDELTPEDIVKLSNLVNGSEDLLTDKTNEDNLLILPLNDEALSSYAKQQNDIYYNTSTQTSKTEPHNSINNDSSLIINNGGYFFYYLNAIEALAPEKTISIKLNVKAKDEKAKLQYGFVGTDGRYIGTIQSIPRKDDTNIYFIENIKIPPNSVKISLRLDNREATKNTEFISIQIFSGSLQKKVATTGINEIVQQLTKKVEKLEEQNSINTQSEEEPKENKSVIENKLPLKYVQPKSFALKKHILSGHIYTDGNGKYNTDFDFSILKHGSGQTYYVSGNGNDANDGLTKKTALKNIYAALNKSDVGTIMIDGQFNYYRTKSGYHVGTINKDVNLIGYNGKPKIICAEELTFVPTTDKANVKHAQRTSVARVIDLNQLDDAGDYLELNKVNSVDEVNETPNTWFTENRLVYVNSDSENLACLLNAELLKIQGNHHIYLENIELIGGRRNIRFETETGELILNDIRGSYCVQSNGNGLEMVGGNYCVSNKVEFSKEILDGFNYHKGMNNSLPYFIEIDCIGRDNGFEQGSAGQKSNNGSTSHDGVKGIRINGIYIRNDGGNIAEVNEGTSTLNLACTSSESYQPYSVIVSAAECYFEFCKSFGNEQAVLVSNNGKLLDRMSNFIGIATNVEGSQGQYQKY